MDHKRHLGAIFDDSEQSSPKGGVGEDEGASMIQTPLTKEKKRNWAILDQHLHRSNTGGRRMFTLRSNQAWITRADFADSADG